MFRVIHKAHDRIIADRGSEDTGFSQYASNWKPNLRRIKKGLLSLGHTSHFDRRYTKENYATSRPVGLGIYKTEEHVSKPTIKDSTPRYVPDKAVDSYSLQRPRPKGPRDPNTSKGFKFLQRTLSTPKKPPHNKSPRVSVDIEQKSSDKSDGDGGAQRPGTAPNIPQQVAADFFSNPEWKESRKPKPPPHLIPYTPRNPVFDFPKTQLPTQHDQTYLTVNESNDYQDFLTTSRIAASHTHNIHGVIRPNKYSPPKTTTTDHNLANHRASMTSFQSSSTSIPVRRSGYLPEKPPEYHKHRPRDSVYSQRTLDDKASYTGSSYTQDDRWSRDGYHLSKSLSIDRDREKDKSSMRPKTKRVMPVSLGLKRYNRFVKAVSGE
jgi:hypothetical protein